MVQRRRRDSARVVVVDGLGSVLLFRIVDPQSPGPPVWVTPGGSTEVGETLADTARRELDTADEVEYFRNGGILHYVLREMARAA